MRGNHRVGISASSRGEGVARNTTPWWPQRRRAYHTVSMETPPSLRIDKWLWAARFFKTRGLAAGACTGGKVDVNDEAAKPAKPVRAGDMIRITLPQGPRRIVKVLGPDEPGARAAQPRRLC